MARVIFSICILLGISCCAKRNQNAGNEAGSDDAEKSSSLVEDLIEDQSEVYTGKVDFVSFLDFFQDGLPIEKWGSISQDELMEKQAIYNPSKREKVLKDNFKRIPTEFSSFISWDALRQAAKPWEAYPETYPKPESIFKLYGLAKEKRENHWIVSWFAFNDAPAESGFETRHAFIIATYSLEGEQIDEYAWWWMQFVDHEWWESVYFKGDTFMEGSSPDGVDKPLKEVYSKTIITPSGKFKTVWLGNFDKPDPVGGDGE